MRFLTLLKEKSVPEWWSCYYDYENMKVLISIVTKGHNIIAKIKQQNIMIDENEETSLHHLQSPEGNIENFINKIALNTNQLFFKYHLLNKKVVFLFLQLKIHELTERLQLYEKWESKVQEKMDDFLILIFNLYFQTTLLNQTCQMHMQAYKKIQKKHRKAFEIFGLDTPFFRIIRLKRSILQLNNHSQKLAQLYHKHKQVEPRIAKKQLEEQMEGKSSAHSVYSYLFGFINGINIPLLILPFILLNSNELSSQNWDKLNKENLMWWGIGYSVLYIWIAAASFKVFENHRINYQLIFQIDDHTKKSYWPLALSSITSLGFLLLFNLYTLNLTGINNRVISQNQEDRYFPFGFGLVVIIILAFFSILKKPYCILPKIIYDLCRPWNVAFRPVWLTEQLITFIQPIAIVGYLICYTFSSSQDGENCSDNRPSYNLIAEGFAILFFFFRFVQTIFVSWENQKFWKTLEMLIVIRCFLNITIVIFSMLSSFLDGAQIVWYCLAPFGIFYNYWLDFIHDWDISDSFSEMKRESVIIHKKGFMIFRIGYLFLRIGWLLNISPNITYYISTELWLLITVGLIELVRRLLWNVLRVEKEHLINCRLFRVKNDNTKKQDEVKKEVLEHGLGAMQMQPLSIQRSQQEKDAIYEILEDKVKLQKLVISFSQDAIASLNKIENEIFNK